MDDEDKQLSIDELMMDNLATTIEKTQFAETILPKYGTVSIDKYTLKNQLMSVDIINYGSTITSIKLPDENGKISDIVLGFDDMEGYTSSNNPYFGATIGRVANRISNGSFEYEDNKYYLSKNAEPNTLHGGVCGFDKKMWNAKIVNSNVLEMTYVSPDLEEGFPGELEVNIKYTLTDNNYLVIKITATTNKTTPVNITNHSYFNLAGHDTGAEAIYDHELRIRADRYTELDPKSLIPTGKMISVKDTAYDFREFRKVGEAINDTDNKFGIDINYCFMSEYLKAVGRLEHKKSGRSLLVYSNKPGVQLYTSNYVNNVKGKNGAVYDKHSAICLEPQCYPDAVNHEKFPQPWLAPREKYEHIIVYEFRVKMIVQPHSEAKLQDLDKESEEGKVRKNKPKHQKKKSVKGINKNQKKKNSLKNKNKK